MIWLTWRQFRPQVIVAAAGLAALAVVLGLTGMHVAHLYDTSGIGTCRAHGNCGPLTGNFMTQVKTTLDEKAFYLGIGVLYLAPAVIGVFWGAPLIARELEAGTFRLAWTQSITRTRWLAVKLGLVGLASMVVAGLVSLMVSWWEGPINRAASFGDGGKVGSSSSFARLSPVLFGASGIAPIGYAAFAFTLGVTVGVFVRRTVPAMAITLVIFAAAQAATPLWIRPHLSTPAQSATPLTLAGVNGLTFSGGGRLTVVTVGSEPGGWVLSSQTITPAGRVFTGPAPKACEGVNSFKRCADALVSLHLRTQVTYQPATRYWPFQWYETSMYLAAALALTGLCIWRVRRRRVA
jgi:ABC-2 family transporter protein